MTKALAALPTPCPLLATRGLLRSFLVFVALVPQASQAGSLSTIGPDLAQIRALAQTEGERVWPGYGAAPFGMLIVADGRETLLCQPNPPKGFTSEGRDPATGCDRLVRPRSNLPDNLLAAMPVFGSSSTIVMGTPERTGFSRYDWLRTILHEHFHQWQASRPGYFSRVDALDLKNGDETGMWMLNFSFPYNDAKVGQAYATASLALAEVLDARGTAGFVRAFDRYINARHRFAETAGPRNWRYLEFELWQEGGARWTEYALANMSQNADMRASAVAGEGRTLTRLRRPDLAQQGRELVYTLGAAEVMLIDACGPTWRQAYPSATNLGSLIEAARTYCKRS